MRSRPALVIALFLIGMTGEGLLPGAALAQSSSFTFAKVVDTETLLPGAAGLYRGTESAPALEAGRVAFWAYGDETDGVYTGAPGGPLSLVADTTTLIPGAPVPFDGHDYVSLDRGRTVFIGWGQDDQDSYYEGIYRFENGALNRIADLTTPVPGKPTGFRGFLEFYGPSSTGNGQVAFIGVDFDEVEEGIYVGNGGPVARVADTTTSVPDSAEQFEFFYEVSADREKVAFIADSPSATGIYFHDTATGALARIADTTSQVPSLSENFVDFAGLDLESDSVAFIGQFGEGRFGGGGGIYVFDTTTGAITRSADTTMEIPGTANDFRDAFTAVAIDDGHVALGYGYEGNPRIGTPQTPYFGVYTDLGGELDSLLRAGDMLDGKPVIRAYVGPAGLDGNQVAMTVEFVDGSEGIYIATLIPEPTSFALLLAAGLMAIVIGQRRACRPAR